MSENSAMHAAAPRAVVTKRHRVRTAVGTGLGAVAVVIALAACGGSSGGSSSGASTSATTTAVANTTKSCSAGATRIAFWAWVPGISRAVSAFNASHPKICVQLSDVGAGDPEYVKLTQALKAGSGAPDVAEVEYDELPSFEITHDVLNLVPYGAQSVKSDFVPWVWSEVSQGANVYAIPGDTGPMGLYYNSKLFAKYHLTVPTTWAQYAADAAKLHSANSSSFITNFSATDLQWVLALMAQAEAFPFQYTGGKNVTIDFTGPKQQAFTTYWQKLFSGHEVNGLTDVAAPAFGDMDNGTDATWLSSAWGPSYFAPDAKKTSGDWRAAPMPQWTAGAGTETNWGGSSYPVFKGSAHPQQAATFAEWLNSSPAAWKITITPASSLFPSYEPTLNSKTFTSTLEAPSGQSHPFKVFAVAGKKTGAVQWPPFMTEALTQATTDLAPAMAGKQTLAQGFTTLQNHLVSYAKAQGFSVSTS
jgi:multiple sugar transport system substrate-binding protein